MTAKFLRMKYLLKQKLLAYKRTTKVGKKQVFNCFKLLQMFSSSEKLMVDRSIPDYDYICYTPQTILTANRVNEHLYIDFPRKVSKRSLKPSYLDLDSDVTCEEDSERF